MGSNRYMIIVLGGSKGIDDDLYNIADGEHGVNYVDGNGIFIGTFYSHYETVEIYELLSDRPAFLLFNISDGNQHMVNLPSKYYKGLFPEIGEVLPKLEVEDTKIVKEVKTETISESLDINDILDKLQENNYDLSCLTKKESEILKNYH